MATTKDFVVNSGADINGTLIARSSGAILGSLFNDSSALNLQAGSNSTAGLKVGTSAATPLVWYTNGIERLRIDSSGNFGFGTSTPNYGSYSPTANTVVTIKGKQSYGALELATSTAFADTNTLGQLNFVNPAGAGSDHSSAVIQGQQDGTDSVNPGGRLGFYTRANGGALNLRMTINALGLVGIGTSSPGAPLHVHSTSGRCPTSRLIKTPQSILVLPCPEEPQACT